ncbi:MAG: YqeG family HAD IIIA-type phosphatase, partial [Ruminococcaceae bacterium]|nr:YqeG family HAD IIIA-type phosphatase [Oscillospiraceae bacterium]
SHFRKEEDGYYRISRVSREVIDRASGEVLRRETVLDNHSRVMYDPKLIPSDEIRDF